MPTKPKPTTVKPSAPKAEPSLYKAIRDRLETKDKETLHARTKKAVEAVEHLLEGVQPAADVSGPSETVVASVVPTRIPWSLEGLVVDPGEEAMGQWGFFWDNAQDVELRFDVCGWVNSDKEPYSSKFDGRYQHFAYIPNFPGAALLKATTGCEVS